MKDIMAFYKGKRVLITGHTGFKGSWLCRLLLEAGADITGYALNMTTQPNLYELADLQHHMKSVIADVRDFEQLKKIFIESQPEFVFHLAAQPIVREGYRNPIETYSTNVMGTVHLLECIRNTNSVRSVVNVTTDKVYDNVEWHWGYRESDRLDGYDPYSNSKSCAELVTHCYIRSFFQDTDIAVSTARAGNVIGGGDFAANRIIPDCVRAVVENKPIILRNPYSIRPYQHVLEPLMAYLLIAKRQYESFNLSGCYNIGPDECDCITTAELTNLFCEAWGEKASWRLDKSVNALHEANILRLDCSKIKHILGWKSTWRIKEAVAETVNWTKVWRNRGDIFAEMEREIKLFTH